MSLNVLLGSLLALMAVGSAHAEEGCVDYSIDPSQLVVLEADATRGALSQQAKDCLEQSYAASAVQTTKDKISRVLLVNAYAYSTDYWSKLVRRHLDEVDQSDPDIAFLYAFYLFNTNPQNFDPDEVIRWVEVSLERRDVWTGDVYVGRVNGLMRLRAVASSMAWERAEEARTAGKMEEEEVNLIRNQTKTFAREWLDFAKVAGRDTEQALSICLGAATHQKACGLGEGSE